MTRLLANRFFWLTVFTGILFGTLVLPRMQKPVHVSPVISTAAVNCLASVNPDGSTKSCGATSLQKPNQTPVKPASTPPPPSAAAFLTVVDVEKIISQAVGEAQARNIRGTVAVVDRVGNVLGVFRMTGASPTFTIRSGRSVTGGLEGISILPDGFATISKAITGAYLSSSGNAFSTRTASQIIQQNFNPGEISSPSGPLFGVQFSQFSCSDLMSRQVNGSYGPKRSPLGLSADAGGLPLYKNGFVVGGIGVITDADYSLDLNIQNFDIDNDELVAVAGTSGFSAPTDIRANRITADGRTLRYTDSEAVISNPGASAPFASLPGSLIAVPGYAAAATIAGTGYGSAMSGIRPDTGSFASLNGYVLVDAFNLNRYPTTGGTDSLLTSVEVNQILLSALDVANRARAQIRRPTGSAAEVTITVVDTQGEVLGLVRTPDAPVFGTDVALQKARTAAFFSNINAATELNSLPAANYLVPASSSSISSYVTQLQSFLGNPSSLSNGIAYSNRAIGNIARPYFPDGIAGAPAGPLSKPISGWSPFQQGLQLDLSYNNLIASAVGSPVVGCTSLNKLRNGIQIFPGSVPIYRGNQLVGAIGVSGDGVDQDDMIAFLGLANAGQILATGIANAPAAIRADTLVPAGTGTRLRYVQCPQTPFNNSSAQNVCAGL
ncbi:MAG: heme-binding protein [Arenimonas sp.]